MKAKSSAARAPVNPHHLSAAQVTATIQASGLTRQEFAQQVGCGTSQLFKYGQEGLPPRMDRAVRAAILQSAVQYGIVPGNAALRAGIQKLAKGSTKEQPNFSTSRADNADNEPSAP